MGILPIACTRSGKAKGLSLGLGYMARGVPSGRSYADVAYLLRTGSGRPALLVELKWDQPVSAAVD